MEELARNAACFEQYAKGKHGPGTAGLPQVMGVADGTHIPIRKPDGTGDSFINLASFLKIFMLSAITLCVL